MLLRQKHFLPREPAEQQFLLKSSRAFARGLLPRKRSDVVFAAKPVVFPTRLSLSERKPLALVLEKFQKTEQAAFLDPCGQTFSSLIQASDFLIGNKK